MNQDELFMREALKEAEIASAKGDWPIGCVLVLDGEVVARGRNEVYTKGSKTCHGEMMAIQQVPNILRERSRDVTMYVTYEPCPMCLGAFLLNHIGRLVCGPDLDESGALDLISTLPARFKKPKYEFEVTRGILEAECHRTFMSAKKVKKMIESQDLMLAVQFPNK